MIVWTRNRIIGSTLMHGPTHSFTIGGCATTNGSPIITTTVPNGFGGGLGFAIVNWGDCVSGTNITGTANVLTQDSSTQITIDRNATGTSSGLTLTFYRGSIEDLDFPLTNTLTPGRYLTWKVPAGSPPTLNDQTFEYFIDFDLGSSLSIDTVISRACRTYPAGSGAILFDFFYAGGSTYPPAAWTQWTDDSGTENNSIRTFTPASMRYFRFGVYGNSQFSVKPWVAAVADKIDLGTGYSEDTQESDRRNRFESRSMSGVLSISECYDKENFIVNYRDLQVDLSWRDIPETPTATLPNLSLATFKALADFDETFMCTFVDASIREFDLADGAVSWTHKTNGLFDVALKVVELV